VAVARGRLIEQILDHIQVLSTDLERLSGAAAAFIGLNRTDLRALQLVRASGGLTAGDLAKSLQVTSGATTRVIDSLVAMGHARRESDPGDRRRVLIKLSPEAEKILDSTFEQLREQVRLALESYADEDLETVARFLADVRALIRAHARRLDVRSPPGDAP
jgi:DNA-binding MarR family transcriptional regulator